MTTIMSSLIQLELVLDSNLCQPGKPKLHNRSIVRNLVTGSIWSSMASHPWTPADQKEAAQWDDVDSSIFAPCPRQKHETFLTPLSLFLNEHCRILEMSEAQEIKLTTGMQTLKLYSTSITV